MTATTKAGATRKPATSTAAQTADTAKPRKTVKTAPTKDQAAAPKAPAKRSRKVAKVDPELRRHYVEVAAYYIAERRGFLDGCANEDWVQAELEIDRLLAENKLSA
jgi:hypothetical protein